ncbi:MAG: hypothetical protein KAX24_15075, partial [Anaerolineae bacterium]|nr:hypothetical protein [Anaerolineae bacterium]
MVAGALWLALDDRLYVYHVNVVGAVRVSPDEVFRTSGLPGLHILWARSAEIEARVLTALPTLESARAVCGLQPPASGTGLPAASCTISFIPDPATLAGELLAGRCDVVTHEGADAVRAMLPPSGGDEGGGVTALSTYDARWEFLAFGISPASGYDRPDFFEDVRVRQGIALCIDRQALEPTGRVSHSYLPPEHPLYAGDVLTTWGYDREAGQKLLATAGWYDEDGDGVREAHAIPGIPDGTPFQVTYRTTDEPLRAQTAQLIQANLAACGIQVSVETMPSETLFAPGPEGALFGRRFDLAQFSWRAASDPLCDLFLSSQIPDAGHWDRPNVAGFLD